MRGEAGDRVHLVEHQLAGGREEEIDAREARAAERAVDCFGRFLNAQLRCRVYARGHVDAGGFERVFFLKIEKAAGELNLVGAADGQRVRAEHGAADLKARHGFLDDNGAVVPERCIDGGAERIGATVVPASGGATRRQAYLLRDFGATALCCTPSYALHLWEAGQEVGIDFRDLPLRTGVFGAEPWTEEMRQDIERKMGINALNIYGLSEVMGPGVAMECLESKCGMHLWEDHFLPEIIDPVTGEQLPEGEVGELVITTLTKEGIPLIRYRTRDLTSLDYTPCRCGRTHVRLTRIRGRSDDMLIIRGVNVFPQQIEALLMENQNLSPNYQIIVDRVNNLDTLEVQVEMNETLFADEIRKLQSLESSIQKSIKEFLGVTTKVRLMEPHSIQRSEGKAKRIIDKRPTE